MEVAAAMSVLDLKPSKYEILRELVSEKLTTAALEILAVVERTVSGYEEEAAALRRENDRQKKQLEAVLQPRVSLCRIEPAPGDGHTGSELLQENTSQTIGEESASWAGLKPDEEEDDEDKELENNQGGTINLQVCLLQDAHADMLTSNVLKSSIQVVTCPPDLKEAEFLDLLRSTFPQLSAEFEAFTGDVTRKLTPLNLETVTPENVEEAIKSRESGRSALYIRVKAVKESQSRLEEETHSEMNNEESRQHLTETKEEVEQEEISEDFGAPDSAHSASDEDDKEGGKEWTPEERNEEIRNMKLKCKPSKGKKKKTKLPIVRRKRKNLEGSTENVPLSCKVCQALSGSKNMLIKHSWSHVDDPERLCGVCGEHSESPEELRSHLNSHKKRFSCDVGCKAFIKPGEFTDHQRTHSQEKVMCGVCGKGLSSQRALERHLTVHTGERPYECSDCGQTFKCSRHLSRHMEIHSGVKAFTCSVCGKAFSVKEYLTTHMGIHKREKPYECSECGQTFKQAKSLYRHKKVHSGLKVFMCSVCGKKFSRKESLKLHMRTHSGEKPCECSDCGQTFICASALNRHKQIHSGVKAFTCSVCGKAFSVKQYLIKHMMTHNPEKPYKCTVCDKGFTRSYCLKTHMKKHHVEEDDD